MKLRAYYGFRVLGFRVLVAQISEGSTIGTSTSFCRSKCLGSRAHGEGCHMVRVIYRAYMV